MRYRDVHRVCSRRRHGPDRFLFNLVIAGRAGADGGRREVRSANKLNYDFASNGQNFALNIKLLKYAKTFGRHSTRCAFAR